MMVNIVPGAQLNSGAPGVLEIARNTIGSFDVLGGAPGQLVIGNSAFATIAPDAPVIPGDKAFVLLDPQTFKIFSNGALGRTTLTATSFGATASVDLVVKTFFNPPTYVAGVNHAHMPSGRWADVQDNPNNAPGIIGSALDLACKWTGEQGLVTAAKSLVFSDKPIALKHLNWYLTDGHGADFVEDDNIKDWLTRDSGIKNRLKHEIFPSPGVKRAAGHFEFEQGEFLNQDFAYAFGAVDRVDYEVSFIQDTVRVWFQDRYEWHPVYPFYSFQPGDVVRETNCLHAALVELKTSGAADFWMKGQAEVALSAISV
jgi:hypothetical protein